MVKKKKDIFNDENGEFRARLNFIERKKALATMKFIGCDSRTTYVKLALAAFHKTSGTPTE